MSMGKTSGGVVRSAAQRRRAAFCVVWLVLVVAAGCAGERESAAPDEPAGDTAATFVGREACVACHPDQDRLWSGSHHDLAMRLPTPDTVLGDFDDAAFAGARVTTRFTRRGDDYWVTAEAPDGSAQEYRVAYTFGVEPLQQYLLEFGDGRMQAFDVAWDARAAVDGGQRWFHLQPDAGYAPGDPLHWTGIGYNWNHMCAECHSTAVRKNYDLAADRYDTTFAAVNVSCEACHGPASKHVAWAAAGAATDSAGPGAGLAANGRDSAGPGAGSAADGRDSAGPGVDSAVAVTGPAVTRKEAAGTDPAATGADSAASADSGAAGRAAQVGFAVDLPRLNDRVWNIDPATGLATREPAAGAAADVGLCGRCHARRGVIDEGFRPGAAVSNFYRVATLDAGLYHADGQILDEVFVYGSFLQSHMYEEGVGCGDCHEPHSLRPYNDGNALCARCHLSTTFDTPAHHQHEAGSAAASCVACHMPARTYMVVDERRDHSFRVPRPDMTVEYGTPNACADCHADRSPQWAAAAVRRWFGPQRAESPAQLLASARSDGPRAALDLRSLAADETAPAIVRASVLARLRPAAPADIAILAAALRAPEPLLRRAALEALEGADAATIGRLAASSLTDPDRSVRLAAARAIVALPPQQIPASQRPAARRAIDEFVAAQRLNADRAPAHLNLAWVALQQGDLAGAEAEYRIALEREPDFVPTRINLADLLRLTGRDREAEELLRDAIQRAPGNAAAHHSLGLLLVREDRLEEALEALSRARDLAPDNARYVYVYAVGVQSAGDVAGALDILDEALERFPTERELLFAAATFSRDRGAVDAAIGYANRLVDADPMDARSVELLRQLEALRRTP